ncbi:hypothetical protein ISN44_As12g001500, partial [Arabidopsis suecica]
MSSIGASYAHLQVMQKKQKEKMKKIEKERNFGHDETHSRDVETPFASGRISNKIYPSRLSYEQVEIISQK